MSKKKLITGKELIELAEIGDFEIFDLLKKGLPAYTWHGKRIVDIDSLEQTRSQSLEEFENHLRVIQHAAVGPYSGPPLTEGEIKTLARLHYNRQPLKPVIPEDSFPMGFKIPMNPLEAAKKIEEAKILRFRVAEVIEFAKKHELHELEENLKSFLTPSLMGLGAISDEKKQTIGKVVEPLDMKSETILKESEESCPTESDEEVNYPTIVFRKTKDDFWEIGIKGKTKLYPKNLLGLTYIHNLLQNPEKEITSNELHSSWEPPKNEKISDQLSYEEIAGAREEEGLESTDPKTLREINKEEKELLLKIELKEEECQSNHSDPERHYELKEEIDKLKKELNDLEKYKKNTCYIKKRNKKGVIQCELKIRKLSSTIDKNRGSVRKAIVEAVATIIEKSPALNKYLITRDKKNMQSYHTIITGLKCRYRPDPNHPVKWLLFLED